MTVAAEMTDRMTGQMTDQMAGQMNGHGRVDRWI